MSDDAELLNAQTEYDCRDGHVDDAEEEIEKEKIAGEHYVHACAASCRFCGEGGYQRYRVAKLRGDSADEICADSTASVNGDAPEIEEQEHNDQGDIEVDDSAKYPPWITERRCGGHGSH